MSRETYINTVAADGYSLLIMRTVSIFINSGNYNAPTLMLVGCDITPPIHRNGLIRGVFDSEAAKKHGASLGKKEIHLIEYLAYTFKGIETQNGGTVSIMQTSSKYLLAGHRSMTYHTEIPFYTTRAPCISKCKITGTEAIVFINKIALCILIVKRPKSAAKFGKKYCTKIIVFKHSRFKSARLKSTVEKILMAIRQDILSPTVIGELSVLLIKLVNAFPMISGDREKRRQ